MGTIEKTPNTNLLVYKKGYTPEFVKETLKRMALDGLRIFAVLQEDRLQDLNFLKDYEFLKKLHITSRDDYNFDFLKNLSGLEDLSIEIDGDNVIDLINQISLKTLSLKWRKNIQNISGCENIGRLNLIEYKAADLSMIKVFKALSHLSIKTSSVKTLSGVEESKNIEYILLGNCKSLRGISSLNGLEKLKHLSFDTCSKVEDFSGLNNLPSLETLQIDDCKKVVSLKFISAFPKLRKLTLSGSTDVEDGNLEYAKSFEVYYTPRKHYNIIIENKKADNIRATNMSKLKSIFGNKTP